jgi:hypothetical protein
MSEDSKQGAIEHTLHGHDRAITDINFHAFNPDILATCAVDGYVHCWDLRRPKKPCLSFCDWFAGATQVKWNRQKSHILASSHDRWLRIWDDRMSARPYRSIEAHESKIYGVDWNRTRSTGVVTCSLDRSIKFWDYGNEEDEPERVIRTDFPVWRARHTPFGWGLLAMPQNKPGDLYLYERRLTEGVTTDCAAPPVAVFPGHGDNDVKEFLWRSRGAVTEEGIDEREFQLVSWGEDRELKLQQVDPRVLETVGHVKGSQVRKGLILTRKGATYKTFRNLDRPATDKKAATINGPRLGTSGMKPASNALSTALKEKRLPISRARETQFSRPKLRGAAMTGKGQKSDSGTQIGWMSGIKFSTRPKDSLAPQRAGARRHSLMSPNFHAEGDWDAPENLHDEIIRIHKQLPKVTFDNVDMDKRVVDVSMNGPWGEDGGNVYVKANIAFPDSYPETEPPKFVLGRSSSIADDVAEKIIREVNQIADGFVSRRQGCLDAALCYLLGEVNLEESTAWFTLGDTDNDDLDGLADESSSDDEDGDIPAGASAMMSQELDPRAADEMMLPVNRNANVPLPRFCGAMFSNDGKLVCFFPPKEDKVKSLLGAIGAANRDRSRGEQAFASIKRLKNESPGPRNKVLSFVEDSRSETDSSGSYSSESSDTDSSPFPGRSFFPYDSWRRRSGGRSYLKTASTNRSQRSSAAGTGTGTGTGTAVSRNRSAKSRNTISIHNIEEFTPAKKELAKEYAIFGDGPDVCTHNAQVAASLGHRQLADIWLYCGLILRNEVPLTVLEPGHRQEPVFVIASEAIKQAQGDGGFDSGLDLSYDTHNRRNSLAGKVKWGHNPLAKHLIEDLFNHFEKEADVQMLAMLSCIFSETLAQEGLSHMELRLSQPQTPLTMKTPAFSLDYFPSDAQAWSMYQRTPLDSAVATPKTCPTPNLFGSIGSSNGGIWGSVERGSDPASASYSCGETPPLRSYRGSSEQLYPGTQSLSTSPESTRHFRRVNSSLASSFAPFSRPFGPATASSSPPQKKRPSPVESMLNTLTPNVSFGNTTILGSLREHDNNEKSTASDDENPKHKNNWNPSCSGIRISIENQNTFDDEGCMSAPLLKSRHTPLFSCYRRAYAELLFMWNCNLSRLEILKFNGLREQHIPVAKDEPSTSNTSQPFAPSVVSNDNASTINAMQGSDVLRGGRREQNQKSAASDQLGLDVIGYCLKHDLRLQPLQSTPGGPSSRGAVGRCERCKSIKRQLRCVVCMEPVSSLFVPCLSCGCVRHPHCQLLWHGQAGPDTPESDDEDEDGPPKMGGQTQCPGGCDCDCTERASQGVVESWEVMMGAIEAMRKMHAAAVANGEDGDESSVTAEDWDGDAWASDDIPAAGLGRGFSTLTTRMDKVRTGEWSGGKKKASSIRGGESL